jgi:hypothetical protein
LAAAKYFQTSYIPDVPAAGSGSDANGTVTMGGQQQQQRHPPGIAPPPATWVSVPGFGVGCKLPVPSTVRGLVNPADRMNEQVRFFFFQFMIDTSETYIQRSLLDEHQVYRQTGLLCTSRNLAQKC